MIMLKCYGSYLCRFSIVNSLLSYPIIALYDPHFICPLSSFAQMVRNFSPLCFSKNLTVPDFSPSRSATLFIQLGKSSHQIAYGLPSGSRRHCNPLFLSFGSAPSPPPPAARCLYKPRAVCSASHSSESRRIASTLQDQSDRRQHPASKLIDSIVHSVEAPSNMQSACLIAQQTPFVASARLFSNGSSYCSAPARYVSTS